MLTKVLNFQWRLIEAFAIQKKIFFEEVREWIGMFGEVRDKFC